MSQTARDMQNMAPPADGLWGLRAGGLLAFAAFMDPQVTGPEADAALRFKDRVRQALLTAGRDGRRITVNVVASTAGGTGAGMFLPFTLWLTDHPDVTNLETNLVLIASSAFDNEPLDNGVIKREMLSKGRTGTFAIIRELDLLYEADVQTNFPVPSIPDSNRQSIGRPELPPRFATFPSRVLDGKAGAGHRGTEGRCIS